MEVKKKILNWIKYEDGSWCQLMGLNLNHEHFNGMEGVYIIWHGGDNSRVVRVGQGVIKDRLAEHRQDTSILAYRQHGLFVTWASVPANSRDGIERYLAERYNPLVGERFPDVIPIEVNSPWD